MRRWLTLALVLTLGVGAARAQTPTQPSTPPPPTPGAAATPDAAAVLERAQATLEEAQTTADLAFNLLGIFEAISVAITIVGGGLAVIGVTRLFSAQSSLNQTREALQRELAEIRAKFDDDLKARREEFSGLEQQIVAAVAQQRTDLEQESKDLRREAEQSTLAQSLLPLGERQYKAQDYAGALDTYRRALDLNPNNPMIQYRLGYVHTQSGDPQAAQPYFEAALRVDPHFAPALAALGYAYRRIGEKMDSGIERDQMLNRAEYTLLEALRLSPKLVDDDGESWWGSLGGLYRRRGQMEQAVNAYEQAALVTPHSSYPFVNLANLYGQQQQVEKMLRLYPRVARLARAETQADVDNYWAYFDLLTSHLAMGQTQEAETIYSSAMETVPEDSGYAFNTLADTLDGVARVLDTSYPERAAMLREFSARVRADQANPRAL